nr:hypothetical protein [Tanacetum cinerariifolium]
MFLLSLFDATEPFVAAIHGVWRWWPVGDVGELRFGSSMRLSASGGTVSLGKQLGNYKEYQKKWVGILAHSNPTSIVTVRLIVVDYSPAFYWWGRNSFGHREATWRRCEENTRNLQRHT